MINISGFIGTPESAKKGQTNQFFFLNGRFFKSPYLNKAILRSYEKLIPEGTYPSYFIFLTADPSTVDINIHPTKTEIKFEEEHVIFDILNAATKEAIGSNSFAPSIDFDTEGVPSMPAYKPGGYYSPPKIDYDPLFNPFDITPRKNHFPEEPSPLFDKPIFEETFSLGNSILIYKKYILTTMSSGILAVNIFRARERVFYDRYLSSFSKYEPISQSILFPHQVELDPISISILMDDTGKLKSLGYDIVQQSDTQVEVYALPDGFNTSKDSIKDSLESLIAILSDTQHESTNHKLALSMARSAAQSLNSTSLNNIEAQLLIDSLFACSEPDRTPEGRLCMSIIASSEELDNKFNF